MDRKRIKRKKRLNKRFCLLSWCLIEAKIIYYHENMPEPRLSQRTINKLLLEDFEYDKYEKEYVRLSKLLKLPNTVQSMVDIDHSRPSVQLAANKLRHIDFQIRKKKFTGPTIRSMLQS